MQDSLSFNLFEHWNGTAWTVTTIEDNNFEALTGVSADATNDAWAVGWVAGSNTTTLAIHWNGTEWTQVATPRNLGHGPNQLNAVLTLAPNDAWAVGYSTPGKAEESATLTLILHWDGTSWKVVPSPNVGPKSRSQSNRLLGLTANSANEIIQEIALGGIGTGRNFPAGPVPVQQQGHLVPRSVGCEVGTKRPNVTTTGN